MVTQVATCLAILPTSRPGKAVRGPQASRPAVLLRSASRPAPPTVADQPKHAATRLYRMKVRTQEGDRV